MHRGPTAALVDESELLTRLGGRRDLLVMLVSLFSSDLPQVREDFAAALAAGDRAAVRRTAHRVVGSLADLAATSLLERGRDIEEQAMNTADLDALRPEIAGFLDALAALDVRLRELVA
mgnify:FL=1